MIKQIDIRWIENPELVRNYILQFTQLCFPEEMLHDDDELDDLINQKPIGFVGKIDRETLAFAVAVDEESIAHQLLKQDQNFEAKTNSLYLYWLAVNPIFTRMGYGEKTLRYVLSHAKSLGKAGVSAHVRVKTGWNEARARLLVPQERRLVEGFWPKEGAVEFQRIMF